VFFLDYIFCFLSTKTVLRSTDRLWSPGLVRSIGAFITARISDFIYSASMLTYLKSSECPLSYFIEVCDFVILAEVLSKSFVVSYLSTYSSSLLTWFKNPLVSLNLSGSTLPLYFMQMSLKLQARTLSLFWSKLVSLWDLATPHLTVLYRTSNSLISAIWSLKSWARTIVSTSFSC